MSEAVRLEERADWTHAVANAQQRFVGRTLTADAWDFERAVRLFCREIPAPPSLHERERLRTDLFACACKAGVHLHTLYHQNIPSSRCSGSPIEDVVRGWTDRESDPRLVFRRWSRAFLATFQAGHPWPAAIEASAVLRSRFRRGVSIVELSRVVAVSRSKLFREFRQYFGMTIGEYQVVARLRWAFPRLRDPRRDPHRLAVRAGFQSVAALETHLRARTRLDILELRALHQQHAARVLGSTLVLPSALRPIRRGVTPTSAQVRACAGAQVL